MIENATEANATKADAGDISTSEKPLERHSLVDILDRVRKAGGESTISLGDIIEAMGRRSFGPLLLVPAMIVVTPLSGIPGLSSVIGLTIALVAAQMVLGRDHIWLPEWLKRRRMPRARFEQALALLQRPARFVDGVTRQRLSWLVRPPLSRIPQTICLLCGLVMPFLELVPMSATILGAAVGLFALAVVTGDGLIAAFGLAIIAGAVTLLIGIF